MTWVLVKWVLVYWFALILGLCVGAAVGYGIWPLWFVAPIPAAMAVIVARAKL